MRSTSQPDTSRSVAPVAPRTTAGTARAPGVGVSASNTSVRDEEPNDGSQTAVSAKESGSTTSTDADSRPSPEWTHAREWNRTTVLRPSNVAGIAASDRIQTAASEPTNVSALSSSVACIVRSIVEA